MPRPEGGTLLTRLTRILAALDASQASRAAFDYALALSRQSGAELIVVHAVPRRRVLERDADERLAWTSRLRLRAEHAKVPFSVRIRLGDPSGVVLHHARTLQPDVIVVGTHQRRGLDRLRIGSVADRIATRADVPVLLVPQGSQASLRPFSHVAVAVGFTPSAAPAIEQALGAAAAPDDRVSLLHVVPGFSAGMPSQYYRYGVAEYQAGLVRDARRRLEQAVPARHESGARLDTHVLVGDIETEISDVLSRIGADLLVVGVSTRGPVSRALFGSTAARILRRLRVPMLAVPETTAAVRRASGTPDKLAA